MTISPDGSPNRDTGHLEWRIRLFGAGAILGVAGIASEIEWLITLAIVVLAGGFLLRFLPGDGAEEEEGAGEEDLGR